MPPSRAASPRRLYLPCDLDAAEYIRRWQEGDWSRS
jgi:hypothetical protein